MSQQMAPLLLPLLIVLIGGSLGVLGLLLVAVAGPLGCADAPGAARLDRIGRCPSGSLSPRQQRRRRRSLP